MFQSLGRICEVNGCNNPSAIWSVCRVLDHYQVIFWTKSQILDCYWLLNLSTNIHFQQGHICRGPTRPWFLEKNLGFKNWFYKRLKTIEKRFLPFNLPTCPWKNTLIFFVNFFFSISSNRKWTLVFIMALWKKPLKSPWKALELSFATAVGTLYMYKQFLDIKL